MSYLINGVAALSRCYYELLEAVSGFRTCYLHMVHFYDKTTFERGNLELRAKVSK